MVILGRVARREIGIHNHTLEGPRRFVAPRNDDGECGGVSGKPPLTVVARGLGPNGRQTVQ
jgi:hypothetical protein